MQKISSSRYTNTLKAVNALILGVQGLAARWSIYIPSAARNHVGRMTKTISPFRSVSLENRHEVTIKHFGHTNEIMIVPSEHMVIPTVRITIGQLLCSLYKRGPQWKDEIDKSNLKCTVNGRDAKIFDTVEAGAKIYISSSKVSLDESAD